jgi:hypothetical protein
MATLKEGQVILQNVRCGYLKLFKAEANKGVADSSPRFGLAAYLPKTDVKQKAKLDAEIDRLSKLHFKGAKPKSKDLFITDGDGEDGDENTKGFWIVRAARNESQGRPQILNRDRTAILPEDGLVVSGYRYNVLLSIYKPKAWNKICASLEIVQFVAKDEPFGAGPADPDVMPDLALDDEEGEFEA